jgi:hypothetical protein
MAAVVEILDEANVLLKKVLLSLGRLGCLKLAEKGNRRTVTSNEGRLELCAFDIDGAEL